MFKLRCEWGKVHKHKHYNKSEGIWARIKSRSKPSFSLYVKSSRLRLSDLAPQCNHIVFRLIVPLHFSLDHVIPVKFSLPPSGDK